MQFRKELAEKILAGEKTVTRRPVRQERIQPFGGFGEFATVDRVCRYEVGRTYAVQPGRGKKAVGRIRILDVRRESLGRPVALGPEWPSAAARREGFSSWSALVDYWRGLYGTYDPTQLVDRIEFELVEPTDV